MFSLQKLFCNTCGKEMLIKIADSYNGRFCSQECCNEFKWRETLSILGKEYYPKGDKNSVNTQSKNNS